MTQDVNTISPAGTPTLQSAWRQNRGTICLILAVLGVLFGASFSRSLMDIYNADDLYSHALFIPVISLFFVWRLRASFVMLPLKPSLWGYPVLALGAFMLLVGDFLAFMTFAYLAILPVLTGLCLIFLGRPQTEKLWFPLAFLFFMIPMPYSIISVISFNSKMLATESAVALGKALTLHIVQDGSFVYLGGDGDRLLVGDVCGGMRSLVALLAFGALMAYLSKTKWYAKIAILLISPVIAIVANVCRIFFLCIVGYVWGSESATGIVHDVSGVGIFAVAFALLFTLESGLRKFAPQTPEEAEEA